MAYMTPFEQYQANQKADAASREPKPRVLPWAKDVISRPNYISASGSPIYIWYQTEFRKRELGEDNELDINQIKAALFGVKNCWHRRVENNKELFSVFKTKNPYDWEAIKNCC